MASIATDRGGVSPDRNQRCALYRKLDQVRALMQPVLSPSARLTRLTGQVECSYGTCPVIRLIGSELVNFLIKQFDFSQVDEHHDSQGTYWPVFRGPTVSHLILPILDAFENPLCSIHAYFNGLLTIWPDTVLEFFIRG